MGVARICRLLKGKRLALQFEKPELAIVWAFCCAQRLGCIKLLRAAWRMPVHLVVSCLERQQQLIHLHPVKGESQSREVLLVRIELAPVGRTS